MADFDKPSLSELESTMRVVALPMRVKFRGINVREIAIFEGPQGYTEWSPFLEYEAEETASWLKAAIEFGWAETPPLLRNSVAINATLPAVAVEDIEATLAPFGKFNTVKIKVAEAGRAIEQDLARIRAVHERYPSARIRLDANGGFEIADAIELAKQLAIDSIDLDYFEQPVKTIGELAELRIKLARIGTRVAADESVRKVSDPLAVAQAGAADVLVLKTQPLGGIRNAIDIIEQAQLPVTISSALESSIGISMGLHLAASHRLAEHDAGLGTLSLFEDDLCLEPLLPVDGEIEVRRVVPDESKVQRYLVDQHRRDWWLNRLRDSYRFI